MNGRSLPIALRTLSASLPDSPQICCKNCIVSSWKIRSILLPQKLFIFWFLQFPVSSAYIFILQKRCRTLLDRLYLFTIYALRCYLTLRNLDSYLGVLLTLCFRLHRFCPIIIYYIAIVNGNFTLSCFPISHR